MKNYHLDLPVKMSWGKYKDKSVSWIFENDPKYLRWIILNVHNIKITFSKDFKLKFFEVFNENPKSLRSGKSDEDDEPILQISTSTPKSIQDIYHKYDYVGYFTNKKVLCKNLNDKNAEVIFYDNLTTQKVKIKDIVHKITTSVEKDIAEDFNTPVQEIQHKKYKDVFVFFSERSQTERTIEFLKSYEFLSDIYAVFDHEARIVIYWKSYKKHMSMLKVEEVDLPDGDIWALTNKWSLQEI